MAKVHNGLTLFGEARLGEDLVVLPSGCQVYPVCSAQTRVTKNITIVYEQSLYFEYQRLKKDEGVM